MEQQDSDIKQQAREILVKELSSDERKLLQEVIKAEKERIHMKKPHGIYDALSKAVQNVIQ